MKKTKIIYWIVTGIFAAFMISTSIPDIISTPQTVDFIVKMGYPPYFIPFIGVAKVLGCIAILVPAFPRIKEWAYAGLVFDLVAACYSFASLKYPVASWCFVLLVIGVAFVSYFLHHKLQRELAIQQAGAGIAL